VVRGAGRAVGAALEERRPGIQLHLPSLRIRHPAHRVREVRILPPLREHIEITMANRVRSMSMRACSNIYYINDKLDKRTWTYIFGACCATTVFIPSFHNYRIWSFLGLVMTTYTAWYLAIASIIHGQVPPRTSSRMNTQLSWRARIERARMHAKEKKRCHCCRLMA
jgi:hypothetical protein